MKKWSSFLLRCCRRSLKETHNAVDQIKGAGKKQNQQHLSLWRCFKVLSVYLGLPQTEKTWNSGEISQKWSTKMALRTQQGLVPAVIKEAELDGRPQRVRTKGDSWESSRRKTHKDSSNIWLKTQTIWQIFCGLMRQKRTESWILHSTLNSEGEICPFMSWRAPGFWSRTMIQTQRYVHLWRKILVWSKFDPKSNKNYKCEKTHW